MSWVFAYQQGPKHRRNAITLVCTRDAWSTTITFHSKRTFSWQTASLCFAPVYSIALQQFVCICLLFFGFTFKFTFYTSVVCSCFPSGGFQIRCFTVSAPMGRLFIWLSLSLSAFPLNRCIQSSEPCAEKIHIFEYSLVRHAF